MKPFYKGKINIAGTKKTNLEQARGRLILISTFFVVAYVIVVARAADLSIIQGMLQKANEETIYEVSESSDDIKNKS